MSRIELPLSAATIRGLGRKRGLTLSEYVALGPKAQRFVLSGPDGLSNRSIIDAALKERAAARESE